MGKFSLVLIVLAVSISTVTSLRCYKCQNDNGNCMTGNCDGGICHKQEAVVDGKTRTKKGCVTSGVPGCVGAKIWGVGGSQCLCDTDLCNSAWNKSISPLLPIIVTLLSGYAIMISTAL